MSTPSPNKPMNDFPFHDVTTLRKAYGEGEHAASLVAPLFGVTVAPGFAITRADKTTWHSVFLPELETFEAVREDTINEHVSTKDTALMTIFDMVLGNYDRHTGNYGHIDGKLVLIDNEAYGPWVEHHENLTSYIRDTFASRLSHTEQQLRSALALATLVDTSLIRALVPYPDVADAYASNLEWLRKHGKEAVGALVC